MRSGVAIVSTPGTFTVASLLAGVLVFGIYFAFFVYIQRHKGCIHPGTVCYADDVNNPLALILRACVSVEGNWNRLSFSRGWKRSNIERDGTFIDFMNIREATTAGAESIANLASEFHNYLKDLGDQTSFYFNATTYLRDGFGANPAFFGFVAEIEGAVVGYLLYTLATTQISAVDSHSSSICTFG